jgi:AcrR family transcriptional regulator
MEKIVKVNKVATRKSGKETAKKIIQSCYDLLSSGSYNDFSMRGVAKKANMRLANVQYYFPTKKDLINALIKHVNTLYHEQYEPLSNDKTINPKVAFEKMIDINLDEAFNQKTRHLFIQLWPLLSEADDDSGEFLANLYNFQVESIAASVKRLCPEINLTESLIRAEAIASLIEGLLVVRLKSNERAVDQKTIKNAMKSYILTLAMTPSSNHNKESDECL